MKPQKTPTEPTTLQRAPRLLIFLALLMLVRMAMARHAVGGLDALDRGSQIAARADPATAAHPRLAARLQ